MYTGPDDEDEDKEDDTDNYPWGSDIPFPIL